MRNGTDPGGAYPICLILAWTKGSSIALKKELLGTSDGRKWGLTTYGLYMCIDYLNYLVGGLQST